MFEFFGELLHLLHFLLHSFQLFTIIILCLDTAAEVPTLVFLKHFQFLAILLILSLTDPFWCPSGFAKGTIPGFALWSHLPFIVYMAAL